MFRILLAALLLPLFTIAQTPGKSDIYAWKTLKFGATPAQYAAVVKNNEEVLQDVTFHFIPEYNKADKLMGLYISGRRVAYDGFNTEAMMDLLKLMLLINTKYGDATKLRESPKFSEIARGDSVPCYEWVYGKKRIVIGYVRGEDDICSAWCYIFHTGMQKQHEDTNFKSDSDKF